MHWIAVGLACSTFAASELKHQIAWRGEEVLPGCMEFAAAKPVERPSFFAGLCAGVVVGVLQANEEFQSYRICADSVTLRQAVASVVLYLETNKSHQYNNFNETVLRALSRAYPCPNVVFP